MKKAESKWYEKASGKKIRREENIIKFKEKQKSRTAVKGGKTAGHSASKKTHAAGRFLSSASAIAAPMFTLSSVPEDSRKILENFDTIVEETRKLSGKQKVLLPSQIKKLSHFLTDDRSSRRLGYMNDASFISAYIYYFMWWNLVRLTRLFSNLPSELHHQL